MTGAQTEPGEGQKQDRKRGPGTKPCRKTSTGEKAKEREGRERMDRETSKRGMLPLALVLN